MPISKTALATSSYFRALRYHRLMCAANKPSPRLSPRWATTLFLSPFSACLPSGCPVMLPTSRYFLFVSWVSYFQVFPGKISTCAPSKLSLTFSQACVAGPSGLFIASQCVTLWSNANNLNTASAGHCLEERDLPAAQRCPQRRCRPGTASA